MSPATHINGSYLGDSAVNTNPNAMPNSSAPSTPMNTTLREGESASEAAKKGAIETMDRRMVDSSGRQLTDGSGKPMYNDNGTMRPKQD